METDTVADASWGQQPAQLVNLTPHALHLHCRETGEVIRVPAAKQRDVVRVQVTYGLYTFVSGVPVYRPQWGELSNLPAPEPGTFYVVSRMCKDRVPERMDVLVPGEPVRDADGRVIGSWGLAL